MEERKSSEEMVDDWVPPYPEIANTPLRRLGSFWQDDFGIDANPDNIVSLGNRLFYSPHLPMTGFYDRTDRQDVRGEISERAVRKILGENWQERLGIENPRLNMELREVKASDPEVYSATVRPTDLEESNATGESEDYHPAGYLLLDRVPLEMDTDRDYWFTVTGVRGYAATGDDVFHGSDREEFSFV